MHVFARQNVHETARTTPRRDHQRYGKLTTAMVPVGPDFISTVPPRPAASASTIEKLPSHATYVSGSPLSASTPNQFEHHHSQEPATVRIHPERENRQRERDLLTLQLRPADGTAKPVE